MNTTPAQAVLLNADLLPIILSDFDENQDEMFLYLFVNKTWTAAPIWKSPRSYKLFLRTLRKTNTIFAYGQLIRRLVFEPIKNREQPLFGNDDLKLFSTKSHRITHLTLGQTDNFFTAEAVAELVKNNPNLLGFAATKPCYNIEWLNIALSPIINGHCIKLTQLEIQNMRHFLIFMNYWPNGDYSDDAVSRTRSLIKEIGVKCPIFALDINVHIDDEMAEMLIETFKNLKILHCETVSCSALNILLPFCKKLRWLSVAFSEYPDNNVQQEIGSQFPSLDALNLFLPPYDWASFTKALAPNQTNLRRINLFGCDSVTDEAFLPIAECCLKLEFVGLICCQQLTDASVSALARNVNNNLKNINMCRIPKLTDASIIEIANNCHNLVKFGLDNCRKVTSRSLTLLVRKCKFLTEISGDYPRIIAAKIVSTLATQGNTKLQVLQIHSRHDPETNTVEGKKYRRFDLGLLERLAEKCPKLRELELKCYITGLYPNSLINVLYKFRNLEKLFMEPKNLTREYIMKLENHPRLKEVRFEGGCSEDAMLYIKERNKNRKGMFIHVKPTY
ncbi:1453_t:CDS:2 [Funneliformis geosporum]|uniref:1453_t:CDS:1 n=1 Tax=Funneliformis geosporum TaxID=1117311 RepID=A0A9W4WRW8_9GLOM|nr:1453_t:CDS:2 [Funneliformis geosporum]